MSDLTPAQRRVMLARDVFRDPVYPHLELPVNEHLLAAFTDCSISSWAAAVGISVKVNTNPDPCFRTKTTLIFSDNRKSRLQVQSLIDDFIDPYINDKL